MPGPKTHQTPRGSVHKLLKPQQSFLGRSKVPFARAQNPPKPTKPFPAVSTSYSSHSNLFLGRSKVPFARAQNPPNPSRHYPQATQATAVCFLSATALRNLSPQRPRVVKPLYPAIWPSSLPCISLQSLQLRSSRRLPACSLGEDSAVPSYFFLFFVRASFSGTCHCLL